MWNILIRLALLGLGGLLVAGATEAIDTSSGAESRGQTPEWLLVGLMIAGFFIFSMAFWVGRLKFYQCAITKPNEIRLAGHVYDPNETRPNDYLVLAYVENEEVGRYITELGHFRKMKDDPDDGYFEIVIPNTYELKRCDFERGFRQNIFRDGFLSFRRHLSIWNYYPDIEIGSRVEIPIDERGIAYTLVVMPNNIDELPQEILDNPTYLSDSGDIYVDMPLEADEHTLSCGIVCRLNPKCECPGGTTTIQDAWVNELDDNPEERLFRREQLDEINNCDGDASVEFSSRKTWTSIHEFDFDIGGTATFPIDAVAVQIGPSLGYSYGQAFVEERIIEIEVPARTRMRYEILWYELWDTGEVTVIELGGNSLTVPFRARSGIKIELDSEQLPCR